MLLLTRGAILKEIQKISTLRDELKIVNYRIDFLTQKKKNELCENLSRNNEDTEKNTNDFTNIHRFELLFIIVDINTHINQTTTNLKKTIEILEKAELLLPIAEQVIKLIGRENQCELSEKITAIKEIEISWNYDVFNDEIPYRQALDHKILVLEAELWQIETDYGINCENCYNPGFITWLQEKLAVNTTTPSS